ncbi:MAG: hypothetical protein QM765_29860 [Myxococcales bacterium]
MTRLVPPEKGVAGLVEVAPSAVAEAMEPLRAKAMEGASAPAATEPKAPEPTATNAPAQSAPAANVQPLATPGSPSAPAEAVSAPASTGTLRTAGYVADGIGAAGLVAAVICDVLGDADHQTAERILLGKQAGDQAAFDNANNAFKTKRAVAVSLYAGGAAVLVAGLVMTLLPEQKADAPKVGLSIGPDGSGYLSVSGVWR